MAASVWFGISLVADKNTQYGRQIFKRCEFLWDLKEGTVLDGIRIVP
jgi:hypothetical protein